MHNHSTHHRVQISSFWKGGSGANIPWAFSILLCGFLVATGAGFLLAGSYGVYTGYGLGAMVALVTFARVIRAGLILPVEVAIFWAFAVWSILTGMAVAVDVTAFYPIAERVLYIGLLLTTVACFTAQARSPEASFAAVLGLACVMVAYGFWSGDFQGATELTERRGRLVGTRATSLTGNPNSLGMMCFWGIVALTLFGGVVRHRVLRIVLIMSSVPLLTAVVLSGSRKVFVLIFVFLAAWVWYCHRRFLLRNLKVFCGVALLVGLAFLFGNIVVKRTFLGHRLGLVVSQEQVDRSTTTRLYLLQEGWQIFLSRPITGVGLNQVVVLSQVMKYTHSDYLEVLANTGIVGGLLYFSIYFLTWRRLGRVYRGSVSPRLRYISGTCMAAILCYAVVAIAQVMFINFETMAALSGIIGFAYGAERSVRLQSREKQMPGGTVLWRSRRASAVVSRP